ncbi:MAG: hypothetical protein HY063_05270 [Bacteroidetes bacterium]|nr:hypothetical protein [Bacteroidota bacterium]
MIKLFAVTFLISLVSYAYPQDTISENQKKQFLTSSQFHLTPTQIIANFRSVDDDGWLKYDQYADAVPFESAYNLNVFDYFKLNDTYDSDLKKEVFKQSAEYKTLLDSIKKIKSNYLNSIYYQKEFNKVGGEDFEMSGPGYFENGRTDYQVNYDIQKKGFSIAIGEVLPYQCLTAFCPKVIEDVEFRQLPTTKKYNLSQSSKSYTQYLFIPMDATTALEIENNRSQVEILRVFSITGLYSATFNDTDFLADNYGKNCKAQVVKGGNMRLIIFNKATDKIYFDKLYPITQTK